MFLQEIKEIVTNMIGNMKLTDHVYGDVITVNPLSIKIDQKLTIPENAIILTYPVIERKINLQHTHDYIDDNGTVVINKTTETETPDHSEYILIPGLQIGDKVIMLRVDNGQKFIVLSKVV